MKYIIKDVEKQLYLRKGDYCFEWTTDVEYARVFKSENAAQRIINNIIERDERCNFKENHRYVIRGMLVNEIVL